MDNKDFVHLHVHNEYSLLDGLGTADSYMKRAKEMGFTSIALTNHGNVDGCVKWHKSAKEHGIKPIHGMEAYIVPDASIKAKGEKRFHICLYATNQLGWNNLLKLQTLSNCQGFYKKPRIDPKMLLENIDGLIISTACCVGIIGMNGFELLLKELVNKAKVFLEIMPVNMIEQVKTNELCIALHKKYGVPLIATNDCHYIGKDDNKLQEVLLAIQSKAKWNDPNRWKFSIDDLYLKSADKMFEDLTNIGVPETYAKQAMHNTNIIPYLCDFEMKQVKVDLPRIEIQQYPNDVYDEDQQLIEISIDGLNVKASKHQYIFDKYEEYLERIEEELGLIMELGFSRYFLIVWELIDWCKKSDIFTGPGRGSVGGSLVAYCLGITTVDPIKYDLVFSRFISPARIDLPDIDMDFEDIKRPLIRKHLEELYGKDNVTGVSTFTKMKGKLALRDVARVFDINLIETDKAAKSIVTRSGGDFRSSFSIADAFETFEDGINFKKKYPDVTKYAIGLEGQIRGAGRHAAAMCVSASNLNSGHNTALVIRSAANSKDQDTVSNWEKEDAEFMGLMKLDILGLNALTVLHECQKLIKERHNIDIDFELIPLDDDAVLQNYTDGHTAGIFQFASNMMVKLCKGIIADSFDELIALNALNRPGCLRSGMANDYEDYKHKRKKLSKQHSIIERITKKTQGIILYQEQIMFLLYELAGLPWKTADMVRKVISKSKGVEQFLKFKDMFIEGCLKKGTLGRDEAESAFESYKHMGSYSFNKAHAVEYTLISYWGMYLKVHYHTEFMCSILTHGNDADYKKEQYVAEAKRLGLKILLPDINVSEGTKWKIDNKGCLRMPFNEVKGIGEKACEAISVARKQGEFKSIEDFTARVSKRACNSKVLGLLKKVWAFDSKFADTLDDIQLDEISEFFNFNLSNDPMYKYKKITKMLNKHIEIRSLKSVTVKKDPKEHFYFGRIERLKFGYKEAVKTAKNSQEASGFGSCYGDFRDSEGFVMLTFKPDLYKSRKDEVEHCSGEWVLAKGSSPYETDSVYCSDIWIGDEIFKGNLSRSGIELSETINKTQKEQINLLCTTINNCSDCELKNGCKNPVQPSVGNMNIMIVGESPRWDENSAGEYFVGNISNLLFNKSLEPRGISRSSCYLTSICKCYSKDVKTPNKQQIAKCRPIFDSEVETIKPFVMLVFGNTAMKLLKNEDSGIMSMSGKTEWSDRYNCFVCWSIHPASVLYQDSNKDMFDEAMDNFAEKVSVLGFGL